MSDYHPKMHHRRSIRLLDYDYSQSGIYFITICTHQKQCLFGHIHDDIVRLSKFGQIVDEEWVKSEKIRAEIRLDEYVVMPNHFHAIVWIEDSEEKASNHVPDNFSLKRKSLGSLVTGFKSVVTRRVRQTNSEKQINVWQGNYYEHIIRNEEGLNYLRYYVQYNPENWGKNSLYSE